ncbi:MAG: maleylacetoacetate isomerase [Gammaproteobacteria bacterium]|nr:maleylacetoacetate isomerase [Gammaproteobacteria bacterium]
MLKLTTYFRSTAAYRVRIALNLKGLEHELVPVHLLKGGGEHKTEQFLTQNPDGLIPTLSTEDGVLAQSMAILEYLEETAPTPALLPESAIDRAYVRGIAQTIVSDMHPLNNLRVLQYLVNELEASEEQKLSWYKHWVATGFKGIEARLASDGRPGVCCYGDDPTLADVCLIPQVYNAQRFNCPLDAYPNIRRINEHCLSLPAFAEAVPALQPDAE